MITHPQRKEELIYKSNTTTAPALEVFLDHPQNDFLPKLAYAFSNSLKNGKQMRYEITFIIPHLPSLQPWHSIVGEKEEEDNK